MNCVYCEEQANVVEEGQQWGHWWLATPCPLQWYLLCIKNMWSDTHEHCAAYSYHEHLCDNEASSITVGATVVVCRAICGDTNMTEKNWWSSKICPLSVFVVEKQLTNNLTIRSISRKKLKSCSLNRQTPCGWVKGVLHDATWLHIFIRPSKTHVCQTPWLVCNTGFLVFRFLVLDEIIRCLKTLYTVFTGWVVNWSWCVKVPL